MSVAPAGHVAAGRGYRNVAMSRDQSRHQFDFCVEDGGALGIGEAAHLIVGEGYVVFELLRQTGCCTFTVGRSNDDLAVPMVEKEGKITCGLLATVLYVLQYLRDRCGDFSVFATSGSWCLLEISHLPCVNSCEPMFPEPVAATSACRLRTPSAWRPLLPSPCTSAR
jgi:hypothetical protein